MTNLLKNKAVQTGEKNRHGKDKATSLTVALKSVLLTSVINTHERQEVAVVSVLGLFLQTNMYDDVWVSFNGTLAELIGKNII